MDRYRIDIYLEEDFDERSKENVSKYDFAYFEESEFRCTSIVGIKVFENNIEIKSAVIGSSGGGTGIYDNSVIIESNRILICCSHSIFCLSIPELNLLWQTKADSTTCFGIYKYKDSYIIHGELQISRLNQNGEIIWQQSGEDIFITLDGKDNFEITDEFILAKDWENRKYKFDYNGQEIA
ncbi:hypothetical protein [Flavobacterium sp. 102]|uniref:hypothetical protein n=1 Tax=Flavobacterium sp. 102 TaxID=2135623 RepID=UPI000EAE09DA|nr:hypothetical protein [Flavobacterium sp. 102]RKS02889.1 hypothetical protein C8C84_2620 [Flavobacterium sp. 102]